MISYYTHVRLSDDFNSETLVSMFLDWLSNSKNKIDNFKYELQDSFIYQEERKLLKIEDFKEYQTFGIQFTTSDNYKKAQFVVEILYNYGNQRLDLGFYKELNEDSKYISAISLPRIFINILNSEYVLKDNNLEIKNEPTFLSIREFKSLIKKEYHLPLVVLIRNEKCIVNPFKLAEKLFGLAHVICVRSKEELSMKIYYQNNDIEFIEDDKESKLIKTCYDKVLEYSIQEHTQSYMFDELIKARLLQEKSSTDELEMYYKSEYDELNKEVLEYEELYKQTYDEYQELLLEKEKLENYFKQESKEVILSMSENDSMKIELVLDIVSKNLRSLDSTKKYRKREVLSSILEENKS